ncbi:MAG: DUF2202 domain-containing protein [Anaerolineaceae bacterium]
MIKKILITSALVAVTGILVFGAINRTMAKTGIESETTNQFGGNGRNQVKVNIPSEFEGVNNQEIGGNGQGQGGNGKGYNELPATLPAASSELSAEESEALSYMREEEKLAHDVYAVLYSQWGLPIFQNISESEQTHSDAVKTLLDRYGLSDPAKNEAGVYSNSDLQSLYNDLVARGGLSQTDALNVGAAIEEIDILDLEQRLAQTDNADIQQTLTNLLNGSYNHLRSFTSMLESRSGEVYQPQYLTPEAYQTIISSSQSRGGGNGQGGGGQGGGNGRWSQTNPISS